MVQYRPPVDLVSNTKWIPRFLAIVSEGVTGEQIVTGRSETMALSTWR